MSAQLQPQPQTNVLSLITTSANEANSGDKQMSLNQQKTVVQKPVKKTSTVTKSSTAKNTTKKVPSRVAKVVNEPINTDITQKVPSLAKKEDVVVQPAKPVVPDMGASELLVNFSKGAIDSYTSSIIQSLRPLIFLVNNAAVIAKGFSHLALPLLVTYFLLTHVSFITNLIQQSTNPAISFGYAACFYLASAFFWITSWVTLTSLGRAAKNAFYKIALKGKNL